MKALLRLQAGLGYLQYGQAKPIVCGRGWGCDRQYQPANPPDSIANELSRPVEVPRCLNARQFLDIMQASPGD